MKTEIKTIEDAFAYNGNDIEVLKLYTYLPDEHREFRTNEHMVEEIIAAINKKYNGGKKYVPDWSDDNRKYLLWIWFRKAEETDKPEEIVTNNNGVGFVVLVTDFAYANAVTLVGSRLSFITEDALEEFRNNSEFLKLYAKIRV
jgi:hypothetical protein